jgi:ABC-type uncharacterized transport system auxiliary subunit
MLRVVASPRALPDGLILVFQHPAKEKNLVNMIRSSKMNIRTVGLLMVVLSFSAACSSLLVSSTAPPTYYRLEYTPSKVDCSREYHEGVRIWDFTTSSPFNRPEMVVIKKSEEVLYSSSYQWVAMPGSMVAQCLLRDLNYSSLFTQVVSPDSPVTVPLEMTGHIFVFAWDRKESDVRAELQAQVTLTNRANSDKILFRKNYRLNSDPFKKNTAADFARVMSGLVYDFSQKLQRDLCDNLVAGKQD